MFLRIIFWDANGEYFKYYFAKCGELIKDMIIRDHLIGHAHGFCLIVFVDSAIAKRVIMDKHIIDGHVVSCFNLNIWYTW